MLPIYFDNIFIQCLSFPSYLGTYNLQFQNLFQNFVWFRIRSDIDRIRILPLRTNRIRIYELPRPDPDL